MWRAAYAAALWLSLPIVLFRLWLRGRSERGYREAIGERFGAYRGGSPAPQRCRIWIHAVSLGETRAVQPLFAQLKRRFPECDFLVTHMTATGRDAARELFRPDAHLAWLPYDYPFAIRRFLRRYRPSIGLLVETEVWFNLVRVCGEFHVPLMLLNARMSERSERGYRSLSGLSRPAFAALSLVAAQTQADADRLAGLGAAHVQVVGNLKFDVLAPEATGAAARSLRSLCGERKVFLAASTREGEESAILQALQEQPLADVLTVIVPRHPQRFDDVARLLEQSGVSYVRRSSSKPVPADVQFVLGDSLGEMHAYYAASDVAFIGGSLLPFGGQNLIEACAAGTPVLVGPHTFNFAQAAEAAIDEGAALRIADAHAMVSAVAALLKDESRRSQMGQAGRRFCERHRGATARIVELVEQLLGKSG